MFSIIIKSMALPLCSSNARNSLPLMRIDKFLFGLLLEKFDETLDGAIDQLFTNYVIVCIINSADSLTKGHFFDRVSKDVRLLGAFRVSRTELLLVGLLIGPSIVSSFPRSASLLLLELFLFPRKIRRERKTFISFVSNANIL